MLIFSAAIGEGHDLPARVLAEGAERESPGADVQIRDGLAAIGWPLDAIIVGGSPFHSRFGNVLFDVEHRLFANFAPVRVLAGALLYALGARRLMRAIETERPDVVVSTYPGVTELLGRLRRRGRLLVPAVSAITDLASLRYWAHPGVDLHLVTHPESVAEVRGIAGDRTRVVAVNGLYSTEFLRPRDRREARQSLRLPEERRIVVVSGGGWAVGDLDGAVEAALGLEQVDVVALCGRNDDVLERLEARFADQPRVRVLGFTDRMGDLLAAADALVHSTAGLTVLEAIVRGCPTISYGWGRAHIRANNEAFVRFGLADVARSPTELLAALRRALASPREPDLSFARLPSAATLVLECAGGGVIAEHVADRG